MVAEHVANIGQLPRLLATFCTVAVIVVWLAAGSFMHQRLLPDMKQMACGHADVRTGHDSKRGACLVHLHMAKENGHFHES